MDKQDPNSQINNEISEINSEVIDYSYDYYDREFSRIADGPQLEGLSEDEWFKALSDPDSLIFDDVIDGKSLVVPILTPVENVSWYNSEYFRNHQDKFGKVYHFCAPPSLFGGLDSKSIQEITNKISILAKQNVSIVFDHQSGVETMAETIGGMLSASGVKAEEIMMGEKKGQPSSVIHFEITTDDPNLSKNPDVVNIHESYNQMISEGLISPNGPTRLINGEEMTEEVLQRLWDIYKVQFSDLIKDNPLRGALTEDEFRTMLKNSKSVSIIQEEQGKIVSLCHMVTDLKLCSWLNVEHYANKYPEKYNQELVWYFPGIVTDVESRGMMHSLRTIKHLIKLVKYAEVNPVIVFECSDRSSKYVPWIVLRAINWSNVTDLNTEETARYNYRLVKLLS